MIPYRNRETGGNMQICSYVLRIKMRINVTRSGMRYLLWPSDCLMSLSRQQLCVPLISQLRHQDIMLEINIFANNRYFQVHQRQCTIHCDVTAIWVCICICKCETMRYFWQMTWFFNIWGLGLGQFPAASVARKPCVSEKTSSGHFQPCWWQPQQLFGGRPGHFPDPNQVVFVLKPNQGISTVLWQERNRKLKRKVAKWLNRIIWPYLWSCRHSVYIYSGDLVSLNRINRHMNTCSIQMLI